MSDPNPSTPGVSAGDVAAELRRRLPDIGATKLHKLLYYAQGWHLTWVGDALFDDPIEARVNGPVVARLWSDEKHGRSRPNPRPLSGAQLATVDYVVERYGRFTGQDLARLTHTEDPWRNLSESDEPLSRPNPEITHEAMRRWFERDVENVARAAEVERLRQNTAAFSLRSLMPSPDLDAALARALGGEKVRDQRP